MAAKEEVGGAGAPAEAAPEAGGAGAQAEAAPEAPKAAPPQGPVVLFRARRLQKEFEATEYVLAASAVATGSGFGMALLGIAPFTPPNPFMVGLLLAIVQARLAHIWTTRQLRAQVRRHVTELGQVEDSGVLVVSLHCDGGLKRKLRLSLPRAGESKPSFAEVMKQGRSFVFLDRKLGEVVAGEEALDALLNSERVIASEELSVTPFQEESQLEAEKVAQRLANLTQEHLKAMKGRDEVSALETLAQLRHHAQIIGGVILTSGLVICLGGRYAAEQYV